jgi:hypothetical protein
MGYGDGGGSSGSDAKDNHPHICPSLARKGKSYLRKCKS